MCLPIFKMLIPPPLWPSKRGSRRTVVRHKFLAPCSAAPARSGIRGEVTEGKHKSPPDEIMASDEN